MTAHELELNPPQPTEPAFTLDQRDLLEQLADMLLTPAGAADAIRAALAEIDRLEAKVTDLEDDVEQLRDELQAVEEAADGFGVLAAFDLVARNGVMPVRAVRLDPSKG